ncbi:MAG: alpha/beta hydrolase fold domain-containing protein [Candidatus Sigynarchaeota archaeon]
MPMQNAIHRLVRGLAVPVVACNGLVMLAGTWSLLDASGSTLEVLLDVLIVATFTLNLFIAVVGHVLLNHRKNKQASRIQWWFSAHLVGIGLVILGNTLVTLASMLGYSLGSIFYLSCIIIALVLNVLVHLFPMLACFKLFTITMPGRGETGAGDEIILSLKLVRDDPSWEFKPGFKKFLKTIGVACILVVFVLSILAPAIFIPGGADWPSFIAGDLAALLLVALPPCTLMLARHVPRARGGANRALVIAIISAGCVLVAFNALPVVQIQSTISSLDAQFASIYGPSWQATIPPSPYRPFRSAPVVFNDFFYTLPLDPVEQQIDVPYMVHKGQTLRFDWYAPKGTSGTSNMLPVVVAIHGGSWRLYDKGIYNIMPTQKYIASLGHVVVDVQYGLYNEDDASPFTLKDMVMEIANLTRFIAGNPARFHANVSRTVFLGRSAGAHLALVCGLGHDNPYFSGNFSVDFDCVGLIPFYPPANLTRFSFFNNSSTAFFGVPYSQFSYFNPVDLVSPASPPVLCFQGLSDTLVPPVHSRDLKAAMAASGGKCIIGEFPCAGHAFDIFYNYPYNQACIYYMERFLALCTA